VRSAGVVLASRLSKKTRASASDKKAVSLSSSSQLWPQLIHRLEAENRVPDYKFIWRKSSRAGHRCKRHCSCTKHYGELDTANYEGGKLKCDCPIKGGNCVVLLTTPPTCGNGNEHSPESKHQAGTDGAPGAATNSSIQLPNTRPDTVFDLDSCSAHADHPWVHLLACGTSGHLTHVCQFY